MYECEEDKEAFTLSDKIDRVGQEIASVKTDIIKLNEDLADLRTRFEMARAEMYARLEQKIMSYK